MQICFSRCLLIRLAALGFLTLTATSGHAAGQPERPKDAFMPYVELAPFVVNGQRFAISIHARTKKDRRYAEEFSEEVAKVVTEGVTKDIGHGLVIIGQKGEPHPVFVFRKFLALAREGKLDPAVAARAPGLTVMLNRWEAGLGDGKVIHLETEGDTDLDFEKIIPALPLPLEGVGAKLYQLAWAEGFDPAKVEARLQALRTGDLDGNLLARFDWVFYLPPRGAAEQVLDEFIAESLKQDGVGVVGRSAVKGALIFVKPMIRKAIEGLRQGVMFDTVVRARTKYGPEEVSELTGAYIEVLMPDHKDTTGTPHDRAVKAVREQVRQLEAKTSLPEPPPASDEKPQSGN